MKSMKEALGHKKQAHKKNTPSIDAQTVFYIFTRVITKEYGHRGNVVFIPDHYKEHTLFVRATSSTWAHDLWTQRARIIVSINKYFSQSAVHAIKIFPHKKSSF